MKLISCYIEKFGGLREYALEFSEGLTVIQEPNGFGKTTLAEFLRAMFYGFPRKAKTLDKSKRQKYTPWSGGKFGGNLVFEHEGKRYRLERTFGATPRSDSFNLIDLDTGRKSARFSEEIGLELFRLDADSFERSTYLPQNQENAPLTTAGIQAKLGDLVEDTGDINNFDKAVQALKNKRSSFVPYRGSGGSVAEATARISRIQQELDLLEGKKAQLQQCAGAIGDTETRISEKKAEIEQLRRQWEAASKAEASRARYEDLKQRQAQAAEQLRQLQEQYPAGFPGEQEIENARLAADELAALENSGLSDTERAQYGRLRGALEAGLLDEDRLDALAEQNRQLLRQKAALEQIAASEAEQQKQCSAIHSRELPGEAELADHRQILENCVRLRQELEQPTARKSRALPLVIAGILLLVVGILLLTAGAVGVIMMIAGIALLIIGIMMRGKQKKEADARMAELQSRITSGENAVREFTERFTSEENLSAALDEIQRRREQALALDEKLRTLREKREAQEALVRGMEENLRKQLGAADFDKAISNLRLAREQAAQWAAREARWAEDRKACEDKLDAFFARFALKREPDVRKQLQQLRDDGRIRENARAAQTQLAAQLQQCPEIPETDAAHLKAAEGQLNEECAALTEQLLKQRQEQRQLQEQADRIPELSDQLERWQEKRSADQCSTRLLDDTMDFLQKAHENLTTSYLAPIRTSFAGYLSRLTGISNETAIISPELDVQLERQGQARELGYFSAGQTDLVMLCMRLALVDALFTEEKPFVILDDPFVNLDDGHTAEALNLLQILGQQRQIIYLTCNSSRSL